MAWLLFDFGGIHDGTQWVRLCESRTSIENEIIRESFVQSNNNSNQAPFEPFTTSLRVRWVTKNMWNENRKKNVNK